VGVLEYERGMVHAKTLVADGEVALVGSANMDLRSFRLNFEVHALVHDAATAGAVSGAFRSYEVDSRRVSLDAWHARAWSLRLKEGAARLVSPML
jgi:cardiolipin synthase